eukprot:3084538-Pyramimonas_sp.AAC.1
MLLSRCVVFLAVDASMCWAVSNPYVPEMCLPAWSPHSMLLHSRCAVTGQTTGHPPGNHWSRTVADTDGPP